VLPPVLEIHVVWHPDDDEKARPVAEAMIDHYHGDQYSGLIGGAVEVFVRSAGWTGQGSAPRPIQLPHQAGPLRPAAHVAVVALLDLGLARATKDGGDWVDWLGDLKTQADANPGTVRLWGMSLHQDAPTSAGLKPLFAQRQLLASPDTLNEADDTMRLRDLSQSLAQFLKGDKAPIRIFISHTKHMDESTEAATKAFIAEARHEVQKTKLAEFFDSSSIQAGDDWSQELEANAASGAMLCLRTDSYAGREWCHREIVTAKTHGVPVVAIDALMAGDGRGSFLLDHIPRLPARRDGGDWDRQTIRHALLRLVDGCLKRELWKRQEDLARKAGAQVAWWAPHAPEPLTFAHWLAANKPKGKKPVLVLHPDPPLTDCERQTIDALAGLGGLGHRLDILTPRTVSARTTGSTLQSLLPRDALKSVRLGLSASDSPDLARLGLDRRHFELALGELARLVLAGGGTLAWGGHLRDGGLTRILVDEVVRSGRKDDDALLVCLAWWVHREVPLSTIRQTQDRLGLHGRVICLSKEGTEIPPDTDRSEAPEPEPDPGEKARQLSKMRDYLVRHTQGRLMIGGRHTDFQGRRPGLVEEALLTLRADQPLYLAAGFGGATADIARAAGLDMGWLPADPDAPAIDPLLTKGLDEITATLTAHPLVHGLDAADQATLAGTPRPSAIATLVSRGLGRFFAGR
jgi:hypothetical protein